MPHENQSYYGMAQFVRMSGKTARWFRSKKNESFTKEDIFSMIITYLPSSI